MLSYEESARYQSSENRLRPKSLRKPDTFCDAQQKASPLYITYFRHHLMMLLPFLFSFHFILKMYQFTFLQEMKLLCLHLLPSGVLPTTAVTDQITVFCSSLQPSSQTSYKYGLVTKRSSFVSS
jgi:hypothetical protein